MLLRSNLVTAGLREDKAGRIRPLDAFKEWRILV